MDPLRNPKDPLHSQADAQKELFRRMSQVCHGFDQERVVGAAVNLLINAVRQHHATRVGAERQFDDIFGQAKRALLEHHYDLVGARRNIFPFDQIIAPDSFVARRGN